MFVTHNDPVYPGMIVGLSPKPGDMIINVMKEKANNMRLKVLMKMWFLLQLEKCQLLSN